MGLTKTKVKIKILKGEGIECENELKRALENLDYSCEFWDLPRLLQKPDSYLEKLTASDCIMIPGGFSFADHLGSGKLLAFELKNISFFEKVFDQGASVWGICNGFQVLTACGVFGGVELKHNQKPQESSQFEDRWVELYSPPLDQKYFYPVRHGEGRLVIEKLAEGTEPFLFYNDINFNNGSSQNIAGLWRKVPGSSSKIVGLMPHPEVFHRIEQSPDYNFSDKAETTLQKTFPYKGLFEILETMND